MYIPDNFREKYCEGGFNNMFENTIEKGIFNLSVDSVSYDFKNLLIPFTCK